MIRPKEVSLEWQASTGKVGSIARIAEPPLGQSLHRVLWLGWMEACSILLSVVVSSILSVHSCSQCPVYSASSTDCDKENNSLITCFDIEAL